MDNGKYSRDDKIRIIKGLMTGEKKLNEVRSIRLERLTRNELEFICRIAKKAVDNEVSSEQLKLINECYAYYRLESNKRPLAASETRGYPKMNDGPYNVPDTNAIVMQWHDKIGLYLEFFELKDDSSNVEQNITN